MHATHSVVGLVSSLASAGRSLELGAHKLSRQLADLMLLRQVISSGSINRAAHVCNISQPALTRRIAALEASFGVKLLERLPRGVVPTIYATSLITHLDVVDHELQRAWNDLEVLRKGSSGQLRIGCAPALLNCLVPAALEHFQSRWRRAGIRTVEQLPAALFGLLRRSEVDMIVLGGFESEVDADLVETELGTDAIELFVRTGHPALAAENPTLQVIAANYGWVLPDSSSGLYQIITSEFMKLNIEPPATLLETPSTLAIRWLLGETDRVALTGHAGLVHELKAGIVKPLRGQWSFPKLKVLMYQRKGENSALVDRLADSFKTVAPDILTDTLV